MKIFPQGIFLIKWDQLKGGIVSLKIPEDMEVPENIVQQIQISHNFTPSYMITEEAEWNSVSFYNDEKEIIIVFKLDKYEEGQDFIQLLHDIDERLKVLEEDEIKKEINKFFQISFTVFKTRDEVISKLANDVMQLKTFQHDVNIRIDSILNKGKIKAMFKILTFLINKENCSYKELIECLEIKESSLRKALAKLEKQKLITHDKKKDWIYIE